jgi:A/G-specific adenine glycosylase
MPSNDQITLKLLGWYKVHKRDLPWRRTRDPYQIWLSEILLQQTRVAQGLPYFERFVKQYPNVEHLAKASIEEVLKLWQGLGYYSRAHNLHDTARYVAFNLDGNFPASYDTLLTLKGIGAYTAAAISSICFDEKRAVVDGNVYRVLSRLYGIETPINQPSAYRIFENISLDLMDDHPPGTYNQALMEFGAVVCTPNNPDCTVCPISDSCYVFKNSAQKLYPKKLPGKAKKTRFLNYVVIKGHKRIRLYKRGLDDIWKGMYEPLLVEGSKLFEAEEMLQYLSELLPVSRLTQFPDIKHLLTHRTLHIRFFSVEIDELISGSEDLWVNTSELAFFALPKPISDFFDRCGNKI